MISNIVLQYLLMNNQAFLSNQQYSFQLKDHIFSLLLSEKEEIEMEFIHRQQDGKSFNLAINQEVIDQNNILADFFESPIILFKDILANINTFTINNEGIIAFSMQFGNRLKEFKFNAKEKHMSREQDIIKLINQLKRENAEKLIYLEEENMMLRKGMNEKVQLSKYQQFNEMMLSEMMKLKNDIADLKQQTTKYQQNYQTMRQYVEQGLKKVKEELDVQQDRLDKHKEEYLRQVATLRTQIEDNFMKIIELREDKQTDTIYLQKDILNAYTIIDINNHQEQAHLAILTKEINNLYQTIQILNEESQKQISTISSSLNQFIMKSENNIHFSCQKIKNHLRLTYKGNDCQYGFIRPVGLQVGRITKFHLRQVKTANQYILYGVCTDKIIGMKEPSIHVECKAYAAGSGRVYENGKGRKGGSDIGDGSTVTITADLINWTITWEMDGSRLAQAQISQEMKANRLYFIIIMYCQNDEVEIQEKY